MNNGLLLNKEGKPQKHSQSCVLTGKGVQCPNRYVLHSFHSFISSNDARISSGIDANPHGFHLQNNGPKNGKRKQKNGLGPKWIPQLSQITQPSPGLFHNSQAQQSKAQNHLGNNNKAQEQNNINLTLVENLTPNPKPNHQLNADMTPRVNETGQLDSKVIPTTGSGPASKPIISHSLPLNHPVAPLNLQLLVQSNHHTPSGDLTLPIVSANFSQPNTLSKDTSMEVDPSTPIFTTTQPPQHGKSIELSPTSKPRTLNLCINTTTTEPYTSFMVGAPPAGQVNHPEHDAWQPTSSGGSPGPSFPDTSPQRYPQLLFGKTRDPSMAANTFTARHDINQPSNTIPGAQLNLQQGAPKPTFLLSECTKHTDSTTNLYSLAILGESGTTTISGRGRKPRRTSKLNSRTDREAKEI
ncbi:uncharacterized protein LOC107860472 [Capsicum annuum]|uniref:uncharacterized protein LOC107860472 n=1 Tax=Capsicum annuum TaxID=4072 RepID=UPI0007BEF0B3|nr:uncharacterized protein LOC107860472 [Capsicum annuum]XP_047263476.1 uncharacterized protein LOC107860472 [Capsicum annuum]